MPDSLSLNLNPHPAVCAEDESTPVVRRGLMGVVTLGLIAANVLVFVAMIVGGVSFVAPTAQEVLPWGADFGPLTMSGQWWRLLSACFLHFGILHLAMNMYILFRIGFSTEALFGKARYLILYLLAGIGGNIAGLYFHPFTVSAGASGAIFGVFGGLLGFLLVRRGVVPRANVSSILVSAGMFLGYNLIYGLASPTTDLVAHGGGLLTGFAAGCLLAPGGRAVSARMRVVRPVGVALVLAAVVVAAIAWVPKRSPSESEWQREMVSGTSVLAANGGRLVYSGTATRADAETLVKAIEKNGNLYENRGVTLLFHKESGGSSISLPLKGDDTLSKTYDNFTSKLVNGTTVVEHHEEQRAPLPWANPAFLLMMRTVGPRFVAAAGGPPLTIRLLDGKGELKNEVRIDAAESEVRIGATDRVMYSGTATEQDARALGGALQLVKYFKDRGAVATLEKSGKGPEITFYLSDKSWNDPAVSRAFEGVGRKIAAAVGGPPLTMHLVNAASALNKDMAVR